jgi:hypothetical protein
MIPAVLATRPSQHYPLKNKNKFIKNQIWYSMTLLPIRGFMTFILVACLSVFSHAQPAPANEGENTSANKPYKILTLGKQITVKSTKEIKSIMVWTASGHRIVEQKEVNATSFSFNINVSEKVFFVMIRLEGAKPFTEKIGVQ